MSKAPPINLDDPFKPRRSLTRSPGKSDSDLAKSPILPEQDMSLIDLASNESESQPAPSLPAAAQEDSTSKRKNPSPLGMAQKQSRLDLLEDSNSSSDEEEHVREGIETGAFQDLRIIEQATKLIDSIAKSKRTVSASQASQMSGYGSAIKDFYLKLRLKHEQLQGMYREQAKTINKLLTFKKDYQVNTNEIKQSITNIEDNRKTTDTNIIETLKKIDTKLDKSNETANQPIQTMQNTYATITSKVKLQTKDIIKQTKESKRHTKTILIYPKEGDTEKTSEETKLDLQRALNPKDLKLKIARVSKIRNGGVAIEVDADQAQKVSERLGNQFRAREPTKRLPKIKIFDVPLSYSETELKQLIYDQNLLDEGVVSADDFDRGFRLLFKTGPKNDLTAHWIAEVNNQVRINLLKSGRIYLDWSSCKVIDHFIVNRCFKCQRFGHLARDCNLKDTCSHCATEGHSFSQCPEKTWSYKCANCARFKLESRHNVNSLECPQYLKEQQRIVGYTQYE